MSNYHLIVSLLSWLLLCVC